MSEKRYTVNTGKTDFGMRANSAVREPELQALWREHRVYETLLARSEGSPRFLLHDGPPYASGEIHMGTALNKVLKTFVWNYKAMRGFHVPVALGYDLHGLPIELKVLKSVKGGRKAISVTELRSSCAKFGLENVLKQEREFLRLGMPQLVKLEEAAPGDPSRPYLTMQPEYEAAELRVLGALAKKGLLSKGVKPTHWCAHCETALAEGEVEKQDFTCDALHVKFDVAASSHGKLPAFVPSDSTVSFVAWTTTPWTLPANVALAVRESLDYAFLKTADAGVLVVAEELKDAFAADLKLGQYELLGTTTGGELVGVETRHPWLDRASPVVASNHVTANKGTGVVHIAPGHGKEDFDVGSAYKLETLSPLDTRGVFTEQGGAFKGMLFNDAEPLIIEELRRQGKLLGQAKFTHEYPHCWRCKRPLITRAAEQWFVDVEQFRQKALDAIETVEWVPASGKNRIRGMVEARNHWCISRQRPWGLPIPAFYCNGCGHHHLTGESVERVARVVEREGSASWWQDEHDASYFLGEKHRCTQCGGASFRKETDTVDVWLDSGCSPFAVIAARPELGDCPFEMVLEGSDQHRGWFQALLLLYVALYGRAPFKTVVTHGFVVDEKGKKQSKSDGNVVYPDTVIKKYGADVLRLWVASVDYHLDSKCGDNLLSTQAEDYRKLRNTMRFPLANLHDFDPIRDRVGLSALSKLDAFILHRLNELVQEVTASYDRCEFQRVSQLLLNFCNVELSSLYFDISKDTLYSHGPKSLSRRAVQTVLEHLLQTLVRLLAPIVPHLAEDVWQHMPDTVRLAGTGEVSVLLASFPTDTERFRNDEIAELYSGLVKVRSVSNKALELARNAKKIGKTQDARVLLSFENDELLAKVKALDNADLTSLLMTSQATVLAKCSQADGVSQEASSAASGMATPHAYEQSQVLAEHANHGVHVVVLPAVGAKCQRCWNFRSEVGGNTSHPDLCLNCVEVVGEEKDPA